MTTAQQQRRQPQQRQRQRSRALAAAAATPVIERGREGLRIFRDACEAYSADMETEFARLNSALGEIRADAERREAAAWAEYDERRARHAAAYAKRTADSHKPEADAAEPADAAVTE